MLLSVVDHFNRTSKVGNVKRVVGLLLGSLKKDGLLDISNSFAIPFDEDDKVCFGFAMFKPFNFRVSSVKYSSRGIEII